MTKDEVITHLKTFQFNCPYCGDLVFQIKGKSLAGAELKMYHSKQGHTNGSAYQCLKCFEMLDNVLKTENWKEIDK